MEHIGSVYVGDYKNGRMEGNGKYKLPSGSIYEGEMQDGMYHGNGEIRFPGGSKFVGNFVKGYPTAGTYVYDDGLQYAERRWPYCDGHDRRFASEVRTLIEPAGATKLTNKTTKEIPPGCYDIGDGFYNPQTRSVYDYGMKFLRNADADEHEWAVKYARKAWDEYTGGQHDPCKPELSDPRMYDTEWIELNKKNST